MRNLCLWSLAGGLLLVCCSVHAQEAIRSTKVADELEQNQEQELLITQVRKLEALLDQLKNDLESQTKERDKQMEQLTRSLLLIQAQGATATRYRDFANAYSSQFEAYRGLATKPVPEYWIGVQCVPAGEVAVDSAEVTAAEVYLKGGLRVSSVSDRGPAAKAGIQVGDVIVTLNGVRVNSIGELTSAVTAGGDMALTAEIIRNKKFTKLQVVPAKREVQKPNAAGSSRSPSAYWWRNFAGLPADVEMQFVVKHGEPIKITAKRGEQRWMCTSQSLNVLPEDVRPYAQRAIQSMNTLGTMSLYYSDGASPFRKDSSTQNGFKYRSLAPPTTPQDRKKQ